MLDGASGAGQHKGAGLDWTAQAEEHTKALFEGRKGIRAVLDWAVKAGKHARGTIDCTAWAAGTSFDKSSNSIGRIKCK